MNCHSCCNSDFVADSWHDDEEAEVAEEMFRVAVVEVAASCRRVEVAVHHAIAVAVVAAA